MYILDSVCTTTIECQEILGGSICITPDCVCPEKFAESDGICIPGEKNIIYFFFQGFIRTRLVWGIV